MWEDRVQQGAQVVRARAAQLEEVIAGASIADTSMGKPRKVDNPKKKKVEKPQDGHQKSCQNIGNPYQMEDNKAAPSAPPPLGSCCLPFGKDFLCLGLISCAHPEAFPLFFGTVHLPWFSHIPVGQTGTQAA